MDSSLCEADKKLLEDENLARFFQQDVKEAFIQGVRGPAEEAIILYQDWGFDLGDIRVPVMIIHGEEDKFAPRTFAEYLHRAIPDTSLEIYPGQGHLFLVTAFDDLFKLITNASH
jgi:pimeloyl-ACP methyl ester carboxylesterase